MLPPLRVQAETANSPSDAQSLKREIETKIKTVLSVSAAVELVPPGSLPRFEMKGQLIRKLYEEQPQTA